MCTVKEAVMPDTDRSSFNKVKAMTISGFTSVLLLNLVREPAVLAGAFIVITAIIIFACTNKTVKLKSFMGIILLALTFSAIQVIAYGHSVIYSISFSGLNINLYSEGLNKGAVMFFRMAGSMGLIMLVMKYTGIGELLKVMRWLRVPGAFIEVMMFAAKFVFIFKDEVQTIRKAQKARLGYGDLPKSLYSIGGAAGIVLSRAFDRSEVLARSIRSRGYNGNSLV